MRWFRKLRFSLSMAMMLILTSATVFALFAKVRRYTAAAVPGMAQLHWSFDIPGLFVLAILLTALALGAWKGHSLVQMMLQIALACLGCLALIWVSELQYARAIRYWLQAVFGLTVVLPLLGRHFVKSELPRGPRRTWWKRTFEAIIFSFLNLLLVCLGGLFEIVLVFAGETFMELAKMR